MSVRHLALAFVAVFGVSTLASATPITYNYTGTATSTDGIFAGQGTNVTGTFTFDDALLDSNASGSIDLFLPESPAANLSSNNVWAITLDLGAVSVTTANNARTAGTQHHVFNLYDSATFDQFQFIGLVLSPGDDFAQLFLDDAFPSPPDGITPGTDALTSTAAGAIAILNGLDPADFSDNRNLWIARDPTGEREGFVFFTLTSISPAPTAVPEPASLLLFGTGLAAAGIRRYRRRQ